MDTPKRSHYTTTTDSSIITPHSQNRYLFPGPSRKRSLDPQAQSFQAYHERDFVTAPFHADLEDGIANFGDDIDKSMGKETTSSLKRVVSKLVKKGYSPKRTKGFLSERSPNKTLSTSRSAHFLRGLRSPTSSRQNTPEAEIDLQTPLRNGAPPPPPPPPPVDTSFSPELIIAQTPTVTIVNESPHNVVELHPIDSPSSVINDENYGPNGRSGSTSTVNTMDTFGNQWSRQRNPIRPSKRCNSTPAIAGGPPPTTPRVLDRQASTGEFVSIVDWNDFKGTTSRKRDRLQVAPSFGDLQNTVERSSPSNPSPRRRRIDSSPSVNNNNNTRSRRKTRVPPSPLKSASLFRKLSRPSLDKVSTPTLAQTASFAFEDHPSFSSNSAPLRSTCDMGGGRTEKVLDGTPARRRPTAAVRTYPPLLREDTPLEGVPSWYHPPLQNVALRNDHQRNRSRRFALDFPASAYASNLNLI